MKDSPIPLLPKGRSLLGEMIMKDNKILYFRWETM